MGKEKEMFRKEKKLPDLKNMGRNMWIMVGMSALLLVLVIVLGYFVQKDVRQRINGQQIIDDTDVTVEQSYMTIPTDEPRTIMIEIDYRDEEIYPADDENGYGCCGFPEPGKEFPGVCEYTEAYKQLVHIFQNYHHLADPEVMLMLGHAEQTEVVTFDEQPITTTKFPERILVIEYDGINKVTYFLERNRQVPLPGAV